MRPKSGLMGGSVEVFKMERRKEERHHAEMRVCRFLTRSDRPALG